MKSDKVSMVGGGYVATIKIKGKAYNGVVGMKMEVRYQPDYEEGPSALRIAMLKQDSTVVCLDVTVLDYLRIEANGDIGKLYCARAEVHGNVKDAVVSMAKCTGSIGNMLMGLQEGEDRYSSSAYGISHIKVDKKRNVLTLAKIVKLYEVNEHLHQTKKIERATVIHIEGSINELVLEQATGKQKDPSYFLSDIIIKGDVSDVICYGTLGLAGNVDNLSVVTCVCVAEKPKCLRYVNADSIRNKYPTRNNYHVGSSWLLWALQNEFPWTLDDESSTVREYGHTLLYA